MLEGLAAAYGDVVQLTDDGLIVRREAKVAGKVGLVIGNGTGHEPAMIGLIGPGWLDVNVPGGIFAAPGPERIVDGIRAADRGAGVLLLVSHHEGDRINAEIALEFCAAQGIAPVEMVLLYDDISSAPRGQESRTTRNSRAFLRLEDVGRLCRNRRNAQRMPRNGRENSR